MLSSCVGLEMPPTNLGWSRAMGGPVGTKGGGGGSVVPGVPLSRLVTVKNTPCRPKANLSSHSPSSRPATWKVAVRLDASTAKLMGASSNGNADSLTHFQTLLVAVHAPTTRSVGSV